jgi:hypothetical protein
MFQVTQSVRVNNDKLEQHGQAGHVTKDDTKLIDGAAVGNVTVKMDLDNEEYVFAVGDLAGL